MNEYPIGYITNDNGFTDAPHYVLVIPTHVSLNNMSFVISIQYPFISVDFNILLLPIC